MGDQPMPLTTPAAGPADTRHTILVTIGLTLLVVLIIALFAAIGYQSRHRSAIRGSAMLAPLGGATPAAPQLPPAARVALDSGNAAYRAKAYPQALAQYRAAAAAAPDEAAPYFGIYMAAMALHNRALADSASTEIRTHTGGQMLTDSALRQLHSGTGLPSPHPPIRPQT
jgi:hypothetical protein